MQFTFNSTISIDISGDLNIDELVPGGYSDSNVITVSTSSNSLGGYTLYATVGSDDSSSPYYNTDELKYNVATNNNNNNSNSNPNSNSSNIFNNISTNAELETLTTDNTWGYSYSNDNGTTWSNYNGLPLVGNNTTSLIDTNTNSSNSILFKIAAKASSNKVSGTYTNIINFYAISKQPPTTFEDAYIANNKTKYNGYYTMQDMSTDICKNSNVVIGSTIELIDTRDNEVYRIAKLADTNCWMLDNLALDLTNNAVLNDMDEDNTNASNVTLSYLKGIATGNTNNKYATAKVTNWTSGNSYSAPLINIVDKNITPTDTISATNEYKIGGYYNYCAATAGSYCYGDGTSAGTSSGDAIESICPKNWLLPNGSNNGEYDTLYINDSYNTYFIYRTTLWLPLSGEFSSGAPSGKNNIGYWWTSTRQSNLNMFCLHVDKSNIRPQASSSRASGFSIRCLAQ